MVRSGRDTRLSVGGPGLPGTPPLVRAAWISGAVGDQAQREVHAATSYWRKPGNLRLSYDVRVFPHIRNCGFASAWQHTDESGAARRQVIPVDNHAALALVEPSASLSGYRGVF